MVAVMLVGNVAKPLVWLLAAVESGLASRCRVAAGWPGESFWVAGTWSVTLRVVWWQESSTNAVS
jgi:hypothetical protein